MVTLLVCVGEDTDWNKEEPRKEKKYNRGAGNGFSPALLEKSVSDQDN